ncbi:LysR family transcriptional regulator [Amorphoplanes digitatis]|uniref:DNA-binding transcriptional LysR family regulator n=1 Tax=Actinoplanes digitatis TaxID=1868 RepID=A0A7W7MN20_9ACTN|nr:LysR family transcriptional regulator [Actinoplanes digitatis]MBB4759874.1 DNA-binding transcriptional LysR family regulator [Actinoplanes digitatis]GID94479.1 LysR family transcriptional regulator [Actinoplanes digitatis]
MDVRLGQLRTLLAVADAGTFTDAAAVLGVSQATVSRSVAALERAFGARLVQRTTRHVALTATGTRIVAQARRIVEEVAHLQRIVDAARTEVLLGYAWAALGRHTRRLQKIWAAAHPGVPLVFVQANDPTAGLSDGTADIAVIRRPLDDDRFATVEIGLESRYAAVATDSALARRRSLRVEDLSRYTVAIDSRTGTTTLDLWPPDARPAAVRETPAVDEWLTLIAAGQAVGVTSEATAHQYPRPGVAYRVLRHAPRISVRLAWWRDDPPGHLGELRDLARRAYGWSGAAEGV